MWLLSDVNECEDLEATPCSQTEFCINNAGSYDCQGMRDLNGEQFSVTLMRQQMIDGSFRHE